MPELTNSTWMEIMLLTPALTEYLSLIWIKSGYESQGLPLSPYSPLYLHLIVLHANVSPESCLGDNHPASPDQFQGNLVCQDGGVAVAMLVKGPVWTNTGVPSSGGKTIVFTSRY